MKRIALMTSAILAGLLAAALALRVVIAISPLRGATLAIYILVPTLLLIWSIIGRRKRPTPSARWFLIISISWLSSAVGLLVLFMALVILALKTFT